MNFECGLHDRQERCVSASLFVCVSRRAQSLYCRDVVIAIYEGICYSKHVMVSVRKTEFADIVYV